jgi:hypothetical protein
MWILDRKLIHGMNKRQKYVFEFFYLKRNFYKLFDQSDTPQEEV